ncbi:hypothetical protein QBC47DRAFT_465197 [Echria macrotheca]|uniref:Uncharacterized protein n=1 Tax=Echria macrotheca TaxID=438768 RepID=A0AAJ0B3Y0_9PEZI|nr:hypothetical protein QBC47DRAFT_465197 [Echria macrotheca]
MATLSHSHIPRRNLGRMAVPGIRPKTTNLTDNYHSDYKAQAMSSTDWRKNAPATNNLNTRRLEGSSSDSSTFMLEMDVLNKEPTLRHPQAGTPWEMIVSAPNHTLGGTTGSCPSCLSTGGSSSTSSCSSQEDNKVIPVRLRQFKPMTMNVSGEEIVLDNRFTIDIEIVYNSSDDHHRRRRRQGGEDMSAAVVGILKRIEKPSAFRPVVGSATSSEDCLQDLCAAVGGLMRRSIDRSRDAGTDHSEEDNHPWREEERGQKPTNDSVEVVQHHQPIRRPISPKPSRQLGDTEPDNMRFQGMLRRLQKTSSGCGGGGGDSYNDKAAQDIRATDPAIIAARVKRISPPPSQILYNRGREQQASGSGFGSGETVWIRREKEASHDSGYFSGNSLVLSTRSSGPPQVSSTEISHGSEGGSGEALPSMAMKKTTKLNPAAAEFRSSFCQDEEEGGGESKFKSGLARFLSPRKLVRPPLTNVFPQASRVRLVKKSAASQAERREQEAEAVVAEPSSSQQPPPAADLDKTMVGNGLEATKPATTTLESMPKGLGSHQQFKPLGSSSMPMPMPLYPDQLSFGTKIIRPPFPVTTKPRDHDPIKQQQYEAYLEWRKANEPGYHMRCKMRQAQRVVRQFQMQKQERERREMRQEIKEGGGNGNGDPAWRAIVEKAKMAVREAASRAKEEKKAREERVREELRVKVRMRSEGGCEEGQGGGEGSVGSGVGEKGEIGEKGSLRGGMGGEKDGEGEKCEKGDNGEAEKSDEHHDHHPVKVDQTEIKTEGGEKVEMKGDENESSMNSDETESDSEETDESESENENENEEPKW